MRGDLPLRSSAQRRAGSWQADAAEAAASSARPTPSSDRRRGPGHRHGRAAGAFAAESSAAAFTDPTPPDEPRARRSTTSASPIAPRRDRRRCRRRGQRPADAGARTLRASPTPVAGRSCLPAADVDRHAASATAARCGLRDHPVRAQQRGPQPVERAVGELGGARSCSSPASLSLISPARLRRGMRRGARSNGTCAIQLGTQPAGSLSGGNAQKLILAREVDRAARPDHRRAADARPRCRRHRLRLARAARGPRPRLRRAAHLVRPRRAVRHQRPRRRHAVRPDRRRVPRRPIDLGDVGAAMTGARAMTAAARRASAARSPSCSSPWCSAASSSSSPAIPAPLMFQSIADGAFLNPGAWQHSLRWALPLFITATGVAISFRCGYFNVGAQGPVLYRARSPRPSSADPAERRPGAGARAAQLSSPASPAARCGRCGPGCSACARAQTR